jgi:GNAT superfamily N-acetyltransferase
MLIEPFCREDIPGFLELAAAERWMTEPWEFTFLLSAFPSGCFVAREPESGTASGFVTALRHERSGWIGNLIVRPECRGNGIGETLFLHALKALREAGAETFWLTASKLGKLLYEKHGFSRIDTISRWSGSAVQQHVDHKPDTGCDISTSSISGMDHQAWGDRRDVLLEAVALRGELLMTESGFLVVQPCGASTQVGPFSAREYDVAEQLFDSALLSVPQGTTLCLDSPDQNCSAPQLFSSRGFRITGSNELMYAGLKPEYRPELIYGLATMGSCG